MIVAIDGPAGAGKSTVARMIAERLGLDFLDTGAMYRALTLVALRREVDPSDDDACSRLALDVRIDFDDERRVTVDGELCEPDVRNSVVTANVSAISRHERVRAAIVARQRELAREWGGLVAEGRDTTTVVFPHADHKFFLVASADERARRRARELGCPERADEILAEMRLRDHTDSTRAHSPLRRADDAIEIRGDELDAEGVAARVLQHVREREARA